MEQQAQPLNMVWGRTAQGRCALSLTRGAEVLWTFVLSSEEEAALHAATAGPAVIWRPAVALAH